MDINVPIGILALILAIWKLRGDWIEAKGEKFDNSEARMNLIDYILFL